jgi:predicted dinucleotide-binding enzyme
MAEKICVLGGGSWGATVASHLAKRGLSVSLWEFVEAQVQQMRKTRTLSFLPQLKIPESMHITSNMEEALKDANVVFSIVPSQFVRSTWQQAKKFSPRPEIVVTLSKGIENGTLLRMSEVIADEVPAVKDRLTAVSGPSHAEEVAMEVPTAVVAASRSRKLAELAQQYLSTKSLRVYTHPDIIGVEVAGKTHVQGLPLPIKAISDLVVESRIEPGALDIVDHKFVDSFSAYGKDKTLFVIQAIFNYYTVQALYQKPVRRFIFIECKKRKNKNGGPQLRRSVIDFAEQEKTFKVFHRLINDATDSLMRTTVFLPNPSDMFEGENSFDIYRQGLVGEST